MNTDQNIDPLQKPKINTDSNITQNNKSGTAKQFIKEIIIFVIIAFGIVLPFRMFIAEPYIVSGPSMDPTFATGHYLIVDKISYKIGNPERNSVVVFSFPESAKIPNEKGKNLIKRIIGLPGDTVTEVGDTVTITNKDNPDGVTLDQSYVTHKLPASFIVTLKEDEYFVMGDNRVESYDSRGWGVLPRKNIIGRPLFRLWPLSKISFLPGNDKLK